MKENVTALLSAITSSVDAAHFQDVKDESGKYIGFIDKLPNGKFSSHDRLGRKLGNATKHLETAIAKIKSGEVTTPSYYTPKERIPKPPKSIPEPFSIIEENKAVLGYVVKTDSDKYEAYNSAHVKLGNASKYLETAVRKIKDASITQEPISPSAIYDHFIQISGGQGFIAKLLTLNPEKTTWTAFDSKRVVIKGGFTDPREAMLAVKENYTKV